MKSQSTVYKLNLSNKSNILRTCRLEIMKIYFHENAMIYLYDAQLILKNSNGEKCIIFPQSISYIRKNTIADLILYEKSEKTSYYIYNIDNIILNNVYKVMSSLWLKYQKRISYDCRLFSFAADDVDRKIFESLIKENTPHYRKIYKITYLLSKCNNVESLICSLSTTNNTTFSEKLKEIIESDLSKSWHLIDFAKILYMSESLVRKKLEKERIRYNELIMDIRMNHAFKLIVTTEKHINTISKEVGYSSTSYFIRSFKKHFGITPKQFSIKVKNKL